VVVRILRLWKAVAPAGMVVFCRSGMEVSGIVRVGKHSSAAIEVGSALKLGHRVCKPVVVWAYTKSNLSSIRIVETVCSLL